MNTVIKISNDYTESSYLAQFPNPDSISFSKELAGVGKMSFDLDIFNLDLDSIIEYKKVALYSVESGLDTLLWSGYIIDPQNDFNFVSIKCGDEKDFLRNKILFSDKDWTTTTINDALSEMVSEANARKGPNEGNLTYETDLTDLVEKEFKAGTTYYNVLKEIAEFLNADFDVILNKIMMKTTIGTDRTISGDDFISFIWNIGSPNENNITSFKNKRNSSQIATRGLSRVTDTLVFTGVGDLEVFGSIERAASFTGGNIPDQIQSFVDNRDFSQIERGFDVEVSEEEFLKLNVGDLIPVRVIHGSPLADVDTALRIIQKRAAFENKKPVMTVKVSKESKEVVDIVNFLSGLNSRTKKLELN
jgi:hypothetical protein